MAQYRYRPADNRTPVLDPVFGHLSWDGVYDDPRCADDPRFEPVKATDLASMKRDDLNELAAQAGVADPHTLPNRQAVIDAISAPSTVPESDPEPEPTDGTASAESPAEQPQADAGEAGQE